MKTLLALVLTILAIAAAQAAERRHCVDVAHGRCIYAVTIGESRSAVIDDNGQPAILIEPAYVGYFYNLTPREKEKLAGECAYRPFGRYGALPETCKPK